MTPTRLDYKNLIGRRLREWRAHKGWPLKHVAYELQVSLPTVSDWEQGRRFPSGEHLLNLAQLYETRVCQLFYAGRTACPHLCAAYSPGTPATPPGVTSASS